MYKQLATVLILSSLMVLACAPGMVSIVDEGASAIPDLATNNSSGDDSEEHFVAMKSIPVMKGPESRFTKKIVVPKEAISNQVSGSTVIEFRINKDGSTSDHKIIKELGSGFDQAVIKALKETRFEPGQLLNGERVAFLWRMEIALNTGQ